MTARPDGVLNILHVLRAPVGGLFRHVVDLARGQAARGHRVGLITDALSGGAQAEIALSELSPVLALGISRVPMSRHIGSRDLSARAHVARRAAETNANVIHGHGAKGGAYARLAAGRALRVYTPHGGSLHFHWGTPTGFLYLALERVLLARTDLFLFESQYGYDVFRAKVGAPGALVRVVHNGVMPAEFAPVVSDAGASDLLFIGELRALKGIDVLIKAIGLLRRDGRFVTAAIVGAGSDRAILEAEVASLGLQDAVRFAGPLPARTAFTLGKLLVVPSRAESLPYVVLEAAAAGIPMIATAVGGIAEIFGPDATSLITPGDPAALAQAIARTLQQTGQQQAAVLRLQGRVREQFSVDAMTHAVLTAYREALAERHG
jgi:glycosyltransferase involved in cell wall biosynthesis